MFAFLREFPTLVVVLLPAIAAPASAAPQVRNINIHGLQIGGTTTITIEGTDLLPKPTIVMSIPIAKQILRPSSTASRVELELTLDERPKPGIYNLWLANTHGVSNRVFVAIDRLPQQAFGKRVDALPVALHGRLQGSSRLRTTFRGTKAQRIMFEVEAQRLGAKVRPVLHLYGPQGAQLNWSLPSPTLRGDARLQAELPADGEYTIELHDLQYAAPAPNHFRLKIGVWNFADLVFPPAVTRGNRASLELIGGDAPYEKMSFITTDRSGQVPVPWADATQSSGLRPSVIVSDFPELLEHEANEPLQQLPSIPFAINGRLRTAGEQDRYRLAVTPGNRIRFEVFADQIGSPLDTVLELQNVKGGRLAISDDAAGTADPRLDYQVPKGTNAVIVAVRDVNGRSGPRCIYRVVVTSRDQKSNGDFQLLLDANHHSVPQGSRHVIKVLAERRGYNGPIRLSFDRLPNGMQAQGGLIPAGSTATLLTLHGSGTEIEQIVTTLRGTKAESDQLSPQFAVDPQNFVGRFQPWLGAELALAVTGRTNDGFAVETGPLPADSKLVLGGKLRVPIRCTRPVGHDGPVRLVMITSQRAPLLKGIADPNRTLRREAKQVVEIPADPQAQKTYDAQLIARSALDAAQRLSQTVVGQVQSANSAAAQQVKAADSRRVAAEQSVTTAVATAKTASAAVTAAVQKLADALANAEAVTSAANRVLTEIDSKLKLASTNSGTGFAKPAPGKELAEAKAASNAAITAAAKATADAVKRVKESTVSRMALQNAALAAANQLNLALAEQIAVRKVLDDAQSNAPKVAAASDKATAQAAAKVDAAKKTSAAAGKAARFASATAKNEVDFSVLVPADLPKTGFEIVFRAELLSRDKKSVLATDFTSVRQLMPLNPIVLRPTQCRVEVTVAPKSVTTVEFSGEVVRLAGLKGDVTVSVAGLPQGIPVPKTVVKSGKIAYELAIKFPASFRPAEVRGVRLFATGKMTANAPIVIRSDDTPVSINLLPRAIAPPK